MTLKASSILLLILFISSCTGTQFSTSDMASQVENTISQSAAGEMAKQALNKITAKVGLTPQQSSQILPMLTQYYTGVATALKNNGGTKGALNALKDTFLSQIGTVLTPTQVSQVKALI